MAEMLKLSFSWAPLISLADAAQYVVLVLAQGQSSFPDVLVDARSCLPPEGSPELVQMCERPGMGGPHLSRIGTRN